MKATAHDVVFDTVKVLFLILLVAVTLLPFLNLIAISFNEPMDTIRGGIGLWPRTFSTVSYTDIFKNSYIWLALRNSVLRTVVVALVQTFCTAMVAYALSRKEFVFRRPVALLFIFTMYIDGGLIPTYFLYRSLGLINTFQVYWVPAITSAWNMLVIRTYIRSLSDSLVESARMEGAGEMTIFLRIIMPLSTPILATMILFASVWQWNHWFDTFLYNSSKINLTTLQYELMKRIQSANAAVSGTSMSNAFSNATDSGGSSVSPMSIRAAMTIIVSAPIIAVYPFLQRYFVSGLMIGGVKE